ncbi:bifunctional metallophosphatase/5'-nucleotidase [Listeria sp. ILCC792]|uniref:bifunctional metallophosphatase/5'-nucleotidase n=1 Tax=Listeria sp. ILCC792 TaxID=1918331 RepID=UPI000B594CCB|nr:5'-nucleotidase C-terminal domain-containing protein [Listeria sp. ILCC792]
MIVKKIMRKVSHVLLAAGLTLSFSLPVATTNAHAAETTVPIQLLGVNDFHGALNTTSKDVNGAAIGGADYLSANLDKAEASFIADNPGASAVNSLRVQAGDMVGASPAVSGLLQDEPTMKVLNEMNFKIGTLGNHEFDEGLPEYKRILDGVSTNKFGPIVENYPRVKSDMQIVAANVINKGTDTVAEGFSPYVIEEIGGVKVGFIGIVTTEIPNLVLADYIKDYDFLNEADTVVKYSKVLRDQGVNAIVVLSHVPALTSGNPTNQTDQTVSGDAAAMMEAVNQKDANNSVDIVLAGHNHQYTNGVVGKTRIVQSYNNGKAFSNVTGELDPATGDFVSTPNAKIEYNYRTGTPDATVAAITQDAADRIASTITEPIGHTANGTISRETNLEGAAIDTKESALGNLITDAQRYMAKKAGVDADFAMTNNGGIRADLITTGNNEITWGAAQAVQPFGNILQVVKLNGATILEALNQQYGNGEKYFLQISGLKYTYTDNADLDQAYRVVSATTDDGSPLDPNKEYTVIINDFLYGGGDGFQAFTKGQLVSAIDPDTETFINYIKNQTAEGKVITAEKEGRKTYKTAAQLEEDAISAIKKATKFNTLAEKDKTFSGVTLPGATVSVQKGGNANLRAANDLTATADANGAFQIDVSALGLKARDTLSVVVTDTSGYSTPFSVTVAAAATDPGDGAITPTPENPSPDGTTPTVTPDKNPSGDKNTVQTGANAASKPSKLPETGDLVGIASLIGLILTGTAVYALRRKQ